MNATETVHNCEILIREKAPPLMRMPEKPNPIDSAKFGRRMSAREKAEIRRMRFMDFMSYFSISNLTGWSPNSVKRACK